MLLPLQRALISGRDETSSPHPPPLVPTGRVHTELVRYELSSCRNKIAHGRLNDVNGLQGSLYSAPGHQEQKKEGRRPLVGQQRLRP